MIFQPFNNASNSTIEPQSIWFKNVKDCPTPTCGFVFDELPGKAIALLCIGVVVVLALLFRFINRGESGELCELDVTV